MLDKTLNTILPYQMPRQALYACILNDMPYSYLTHYERNLARWLKVACLALLANIAIPGYAMAEMVINRGFMINSIDGISDLLALGWSN